MSDPATTPGLISRPSGARYQIIHWPSPGRRDIEAWVLIPDWVAPGAPPIVAVHGIARGAQLQAQALATRACAQGRIIIAPLFTAKRWRRYQQAVVRDRSDLALLRLLDDLDRAGLVPAERFDLCGFSGGAQFAHRFALIHPDRLSQVTPCAAGWYTFPDDALFPYGLSESDRLPADVTLRFDAALRLPIRVCVGTRDCIPGPYTRSGPLIDAQQGRTRFARAIRWTQAMRAAAIARGITPDIRFHPLYDCGHDFLTCVNKGGLDRVILPDPALRQAA